MLSKLLGSTIFVNLAHCRKAYASINFIVSGIVIEVILLAANAYSPIPTTVYSLFEYVTFAGIVMSPEYFD